MAVIVTILVAAGGVGGYLVLGHGNPGGHVVVDDGLTFYQALASLNASVANQSGGPWSIFSLMGIAAQAPYSPSVKGYVSIDNSVPVNGCQEALNGVTMFNGSIPIFHGTFNSGTAPFWQFAYYSNTTGEVLVGTNVLGSPHLFAPFPLQDNCTLGWGDFGLNPSLWLNQIDSNSSLPPNSPLAAQTVWGQVDSGYIDRSAPVVQLYTSGPAMLASTQDLPYGILGEDFVSCGVTGVTGYGMAYYSGVSRSGQFTGQFNASVNCAISNTGTDSGTYHLLFSNVSASNLSGALRLTASTQVTVAFNASSGLSYGMWGLANWMTSWNLTTASGQYLPVGTAGCQSWVPSLSDCPANDTGWYAVLLSASGGWLDSYGQRSNGTVGWSEPVTALVSHQQLVVVCPSSWNVTGDLLNVTSTVATSSVIGSLTL